MWYRETIENKDYTEPWIDAISLITDMLEDHPVFQTAERSDKFNELLEEVSDPKVKEEFERNWNFAMSLPCEFYTEYLQEGVQLYIQLLMINKRAAPETEAEGASGLFQLFCL